jgi:hypothetical protein
MSSAITVSILLGTFSSLGCESRGGLSIHYHAIQHGNRPMIKIKLNGKEALFLIDTGADCSMVSDGFLRQNLPNLTTTPTSIDIVAANGELFKVKQVRMPKVSLAKLQFSDVTLLVAPHNARDPGRSDTIRDGILGADFLRRIGATIDLKENRLKFYDPTISDKIALFGCWSLRHYWSNDKFFRAHKNETGRMSYNLQRLQLDVKLNIKSIQANMEYRYCSFNRDLHLRPMQRCDTLDIKIRFNSDDSIDVVCTERNASPLIPYDLTYLHGKYLMLNFKKISLFP